MEEHRTEDLLCLHLCMCDIGISGVKEVRRRYQVPRCWNYRLLWAKCCGAGN